MSKIRFFNLRLIIISIILMILVSCFSIASDENILELNIKKALEYGLENNPDLKLAEKEYFLELEKEQNGDYKVKISYNNNSGFNQQSASNYDFNFANTLVLDGEKEVGGGKITGTLKTDLNLNNSNSPTSTINLLYSKNLLTNNSENNNVEIDNDLVKRKNDLKQNIINTYLTVLKKQKQLNYDGKQVKLQKEKLNSLKLKSDTEDLVDNASEQLEIYQEKYKLTEDELGENKESLGELLGITNDNEIILTEISNPQFDLKSVSYWKQLACENRTDLKIAQNQLEMAKSREKGNWQDSGWSSSFEMGLNSYQIIPVPEDEPDYYAGISIQRNFDLNSDNEIESSKLEIEKAQLNLNQKQKTIKKIVNNAYKQVLQIKEKIAELKQQKIEAETELLLQKKKYETGLINYLELETARLQFDSLKLDIYKSNYDLISSYINLKDKCGLKIKWLE